MQVFTPLFLNGYSQYLSADYTDYTDFFQDYFWKLKQLFLDRIDRIIRILF